MIQSNLHTHSLYCDGNTSLEILVQNAIHIGFKSLGFSSHAPLPFRNAWSMEKKNMVVYLNEIQILKEKYKNQIEVYAGLEADYIEDVTYPYTIKEKHPEIDYLIGSIHFIEAGQTSKLIEIDGSHTKFLEASNTEGAKNLVKKYFLATRKMIETQPIEIVGHLDKIKIQNRKTFLFDESEQWYIDEVEKTLEALYTSNKVLEINTRGIYKNLTSEPYPSWWVIKKAISLGLKITINSDAHRPEELQLGFREVITKLKSIGCTSVYALENGKWTQKTI